MGALSPVSHDFLNSLAILFELLALISIIIQFLTAS